MKEESKNMLLWMSLFICPYWAAILGSIFNIKGSKYLFIVGPLGCAIFHFRGKVFYRHWYNKVECIIMGIIWLIPGVFAFWLFFIK